MAEAYPLPTEEDFTQPMRLEAAPAPTQPESTQAQARSRLIARAISRANYVEDWWEAAACRDADPDIFFPEKGESQKATQAKAICGRCPVRDECRDEAITNGEEFGVWGELTGRELRDIQRGQHRQAG